MERLNDALPLWLHYSGGVTNPGQPKSVKLDRVHGDPAQTLGQSNSLAV
jgi:hypothetical protein